MSANFMILGAIVQKLWVFEVLRRSLGRVGMCWNQWKWVDHMSKKLGAGGKGKRRQLNKKGGLRHGPPALLVLPKKIIIIFYFFLEFFGIS
jgi:hypothetical protein